IDRTQCALVYVRCDLMVSNEYDTSRIGIIFLRVCGTLAPVIEDTGIAAAKRLQCGTVLDCTFRIQPDKGVLRRWKMHVFHSIQYPAKPRPCTDGRVFCFSSDQGKRGEGLLRIKDGPFQGHAPGIAVQENQSMLHIEELQVALQAEADGPVIDDGALGRRDHVGIYADHYLGEVVA